MPLYIYQNKDGEQVEVTRSMKDIDITPSSEETELEGPWERVLSANIAVKKSNAWGAGKGMWGSDQKVKTSYITGNGKIKSKK